MINLESLDQIVKSKTEDLPAFITIREFASRLRISKSAAYNMVESGQILGKRIGPKRIVISRESLVEFES